MSKFTPDSNLADRLRKMGITVPAEGFELDDDRKDKLTTVLGTESRAALQLIKETYATDSRVIAGPQGATGPAGTTDYTQLTNKPTLGSLAALNSVPVAQGNYAAAATPATTGTMTVSMGNATLFTVTPTGACTFNASGGVAGQSVTFIVTTSGTTSLTLTFGTNFKTVGTLATGTTSAKTFAISFICKDGTLWVETGRTAAM